MKKNTAIVAVIDAGGRGAALVAAYAKSSFVKEILAIPGNDLLPSCTKKKVSIYPHLKTTSIPEILEICQQKKVTLVDVTQDNAIEKGLVDKLQELHIATIGPTRAAAQIEWDKAWARNFMVKYKIPHPQFAIFHSPKEGIRYVKSKPDQSWFVKAYGLAEGKGALSAINSKEAIERIYQMEKFGEAGKTYLLEEWLVGEEFSTFAISDGKNMHIIGSAQDHKRVNNYDEGENTGGMGCSTPPFIVNKTIQQEAKQILQNVVAGLRNEGRPYKGILYLGGIVVEKNNKKSLSVIEFNARWGDPEVQTILPGIKNDLFTLSMAVVHETLNTMTIQTDNKSRVTVAGSSKGYPVDYSLVKGKQIHGIAKVLQKKGVTFYSAGIKKVNGKYYASGGRLFYIVGEGKNVVAAREKAYEAMSCLSIDGNNLHYRTDIGWRDVERYWKDVVS